MHWAGFRFFIGRFRPESRFQSGLLLPGRQFGDADQVVGDPVEQKICAHVGKPPVFS